MDSLSLEKERGITIQAKYTSFPWGGYTFNAVDTPGHADFGGEVREERLSSVNGRRRTRLFRRPQGVHEAPWEAPLDC